MMILEEEEVRKKKWFSLVLILISLLLFFFQKDGVRSSERREENGEFSHWSGGDTNVRWKAYLLTPTGERDMEAQHQHREGDAVCLFF